MRVEVPKICPLDKFYAVTTDTLFEAVIWGTSRAPWLEKIALKEENPCHLGHKTCDGTMLGIARTLMMFVPEGLAIKGQTSGARRCDIATVNSRHLGKPTSAIVALFLDKEKALKCFNTPERDSIPIRWRSETIEVLRAIGKSHPNCFISVALPSHCLIPPNEWQ
jgi:hypothetical protein